LTPDDELLAQATEERRALVTMNIGDFARIDAMWKSQGRSDAGLMLVPSAGFPQNRRFVGRLAQAPDRAIHDRSVRGTASRSCRATTEPRAATSDMG
jgi:hypothetical protein